MKLILACGVPLGAGHGHRIPTDMLQLLLPWACRPRGVFGPATPLGYLPLPTRLFIHLLLRRALTCSLRAPRKMSLSSLPKTLLPSGWPGR